MTTKETWKAFYRKLRIARRESLKATIDVVCYGTGVVFIPNNGDDPQHIPVEDFFERFA